MMHVKFEQVRYIPLSLPEWKRIELWNEYSNYVKYKVLRGVMMEVPETTSVHDEGAVVRGFLVHEAKTHSGMLPKQAFIAWVGVPMSIEEAEEHLKKHGKNGYPVFSLETGELISKSKILTN